MSDAAEADLVSIWCHVGAETSKAMATRLGEKIRNTAPSLYRFPDAGLPRDEIAEGCLRAAFCGRYVIYYLNGGALNLGLRVVQRAEQVIDQWP